ncbi:hypothetical protein ACFOZY_11230 [Chungangia koreensis]|uniref:Uncharacterized protein n=1 Tax=Chungangia koreensis TaxID=752657 RepID=A0ABV8X627_9LACT
MGNHEWDDEQIEQLLSNAPKIKDERSKEDILAKLKSDPRLNGPEKKKNWQKWMPASITAAAVVTMTILVSSFFNENISVPQEAGMEDRAAESPESSEPVEAKLYKEESTDYTDEESETNSIATTMQDVSLPRMAVYPSDLEEYKEFRLALSSQAEAIPVTFLISKEKIAEDFGGNWPSELELYRKYAADINENAFGFSEYHPMIGQFKEEKGLIIHTLPKDHPYDMGSAAEHQYFQTIEWTFSEEHDLLKVINKDGSNAEFAHMGLLKSVALNNPFKKTAYYLYTLENNQQLLVPWTGKTFEDLPSALKEMKSAQSDFFKPIIPKNVNFTVNEDKEVATITFDKTVDLEAMDREEAGKMMDGILLTAASFNLKVKFENVKQTEWNGFDLTQPLPQPIGPNPFYLNN